MSQISEPKTPASNDTNTPSMKPLVSLIIAAYNEEEILEHTLNSLLTYTHELSDLYNWEIIIIDDGSTDRTADIAKIFAEKYTNILFHRHKLNYGLGKSLRDGFSLSRGDYVVTIDADLSYSPDHIASLLKEVIATDGQIAIASPFMKGGQISNVPMSRHLLTVSANKFLSILAKRKLTCITGMVRAYDGDFIRSQNLRENGNEIMQEIVHKAIITNGKIIEVPATLDWKDIKEHPSRHFNPSKVASQTVSTLMHGFLLRPVIFFIIPGILLFLFSLYPNIWMFNHVLSEYHLIDTGSFLDRCSEALEIAYQKHPHTFHTGLLTLLMSIQLLALGFQSYQQKYSFEELYSLGTKLNRKIK